MKDWHDILKTCELQSWKEALAAVMTYAQPEEFSSLCGQFTRVSLWDVRGGGHTPVTSEVCNCLFLRPSRGQTGGSRRCWPTVPSLSVLHLRWQRGETRLLLDQNPGRTLSSLPAGTHVLFSYFGGSRNLTNWKQVILPISYFVS